VADHPEGPIRVALIGYGLAGAVFHGPLISSTPGMSLATIVTRDPERRARARSDHPDARLLAGVDALWRRPADHDLVVVATPNRSHVPLGLAALEAAVFQNRRWDGDFLTLRRLLSEDALGPIVRFESRFERWRPRVSPEAWRERGEPEEAGGLLFDLGSHLIDQAVVLFGPPRTVYAEVDRRRPSAEVDDDVFVALEHEAGVRSHLWMSVLAAIPGPRMRVLGMRAAYEKFGLDVQERALSEGAVLHDPDWGREPPDRWGRLSTGDGERTVETERGAYPEFYRGIAASLRDGTPPPVDPNDSVMGLGIIEAAQESARTKGVVEVG
jgi:predicted dehydrogenase